MKFKIKNIEKKDNSHPHIKIALRKWASGQIKVESVLDVYGGYGMMYDKIWNSFRYECTSGDAVKWLELKKELSNNCFDIDPYSSPYEALEIISKKSTCDEIAVVCTDGILRRCAMMRTKIPEFLQKKCGWDERDFTLMAGIYHQYPGFLRHVIKCVCNGWGIKKLAVKYGSGTWKQATVYWAAILRRQ